MIAINKKLPDDITLKNVRILITCVIKDDDEFYSQTFPEEAHFSRFVSLSRK